MFFLFLHENICCRYSLEAPRRGASNEFPQHMFSLRSKKDISTFRMKKVPYLLLCTPVSCDYFWDQNAMQSGKGPNSNARWTNISGSQLRPTRSKVSVPLEKRPSGLVVSFPDIGSRCHRFDSSLRRNSTHDCGTSLHRAFHYHSSIVSIWLKECWKGRKQSNNKIQGPVVQS